MTQPHQTPTPTSPTINRDRDRDSSARPNAKRNVNHSADLKLTTTQRGYGWRWQQLRLRILTRDAGPATTAADQPTAVDHVHPKYDGGTDDPTNLGACCTAVQLEALTRRATRATTTTQART